MINRFTSSFRGDGTLLGIARDIWEIWCSYLGINIGN